MATAKRKMCHGATQQIKVQFMNQFDNLQGFNGRGDDLAGIGSKLKKAAKKVTKAVKSVPKKVVAEVKRSDIAKAALVVGAGVLLAPAAGAMVSKMGAGAAKLATGAKGLVGSAAKSAVTTKAKDSLLKRVGKVALSAGKTAIKHAPAAAAVVGTGLTVSAMLNERKAAKKMARQTGDIEAQQALMNPEALKAARNAANKIGKKTPAFDRLVATRKAQGYTDEQIAQEWAASQSFVATTQNAVASAIEGDIVSQLMSRGMPQAQAQSYAPQIAQEIGQDTGERLQNDFGGVNIKHVAIGGAILAGVYLLNRPSKGAK
jgi:hypothetical protein